MSKPASRITPEDLDANIVHVSYFTAAEGALCKRGAQSSFPALNRLTICVVVLKNGFTVVGESACASPENYKKEIGEQYALENAKEKIWPLMGYALREQLAKEQG